MGRSSCSLRIDGIVQFEPAQGFLDVDLAAFDRFQDRETRGLTGLVYPRRGRAKIGGQCPGAVAIRRAVYHLWRESAYERERTVRILMGHGVSRGTFAASFLRAGAAAANLTVRAASSSGRWGALPLALGAYLEWLAWPLASLSPARVRRGFRPESELAQPIPVLARLLSPVL